MKLWNSRQRQPVPLEPRFRHELKFLISPGEMYLIISRLEGMISRDVHAGTGEYKIRSLYFDDYWGSAYEDKLMGINDRKKYRIRIYNDSDRIIRLERKQKVGDYICKQSANLTRRQVEQILSGDYGFLYQNEQNLCREFYFECISHVMRPKVIVDYEREPFVFYPGDVRITFDKEVRAACLSYDIFDSGLPAMSVLEPGTLIMEVKFTQFLPRFIKQVIPPGAADLTAVSKYVLCADKLNYLSVEDYEW